MINTCISKILVLLLYSYACISYVEWIANETRTTIFKNTNGIWTFGDNRRTYHRGLWGLSLMSFEVGNTILRLKPQSWLLSPEITVLNSADALLVRNMVTHEHSNPYKSRSSLWTKICLGKHRFIKLQYVALMGVAIILVGGRTLDKILYIN